MGSQFRLKIAIVMIISVIIIAFTIATIDHLEYRNLLIENEQNRVDEIEKTVIESLQTIDKAYSIFDEEIVSSMEQNTRHLLRQYEENSNFNEWNFRELKHLFNMDVYIINSENVITHSSFQKDVGMNFDACCKKLANILGKRRDSGGFYVDEMDVEQETGEVKKYSYMATSDKKYLFQLGYSLEDSLIFNTFNFLDTISHLEEVYPSINEINILNMGGLALGKPDEELSVERRAAFEETLEKRDTIEINSSPDNDSVIHRYVHYAPDFNGSPTEDKVVEVIYNKIELQTILREKQKKFIYQLFVVLLIISITSFIIHSWVSKEVYLANHDSLTGLKNRASFDEVITRSLAENNTTVLLMIDLDNFKLVNDYLGHDKGDFVLELVAKVIRSTSQSVDDSFEAFRLGGDEFGVLLPSANEQKAQMIAKRIIKALSRSMHMENELRGLGITASIGIAIGKDGLIDKDKLYKMADIALYISKEKGKNQYHIYTNGMSVKNII